MSRLLLTLIAFLILPVAQAQVLRGDDLPDALKPVPSILTLDDTVLFIGDGIAVGKSVGRSDHFGAIMAKKIGFHVRTSGDFGFTSRLTMERMDAELKKHDPDWVVIAVGVADMVRGLPPEHIQWNLEQMVRSVRAYGARAVLVDVPALAGGRNPAYAAAAMSVRAPLFCCIDELLQPSSDYADDAVHPNDSGHAKIAEAMIEFFSP